MAVKKFAHKITSGNKGEVKSMHVEVTMLKYHPHPLVIKYIDSFRDKDDYGYLVTEFAECSDLYNEMKERFDKGQIYSENEA